MEINWRKVYFKDWLLERYSENYYSQLEVKVLSLRNALVFLTFIQIIIRCVWAFSYFIFRRVISLSNSSVFDIYASVDFCLPLFSIFGVCAVIAINEKCLIIYALVRIY